MTFSVVSFSAERAPFSVRFLSDASEPVGDASRGFALNYAMSSNCGAWDLAEVTNPELSAPYIYAYFRIRRKIRGKIRVHKKGEISSPLIFPLISLHSWALRAISKNSTAQLTLGVNRPPTLVPRALTVSNCTVRKTQLYLLSTVQLTG